MIGRLNAISRISLGLVSLTVALVLLGDLAFGLIPSENEITKRVRQQVSENLGAQVSALLGARDLPAISRTLDNVRKRDQEMLSLALRRVDGVVLASSGDHARNWRAPSGQDSTISQILVPIQADGRRWATLEIAYRTAFERPLATWLGSGTVGVLMLLTLAGSLIYYLYLRRVLQHLDPSSAVPARVRMAFDTLTEGVLITDANGRTVLTNASFRLLNGGDDDLMGRRPEELDWLVNAFRDDELEYPWAVAMRTQEPVRGVPMTIEHEGRLARKAVLNCAPVIDQSGVARGCMITFNDVTQLEQVHEQLLDALADLASSKEQLETRNDELQHLASRDPLTGCLNRRSFFDGFERALRDAGQRKLDLSCIVCDIDFFKAVNDQFGHPVGDQVIVGLARILSRAVRQSDLVCRYGGEEFCVVLPGMSLELATQLAERMRVEIQNMCAAAIPALYGNTVTASFGVSARSLGASGPGALVDQADRALYAAKRGGRNRVVSFDTIDASEVNKRREEQAG